ncbi:MAG TPA: DMT family transporter [Bryobacteraceae bacterium]|nr:DMT family transporter [Bryobacteraceae bacterium]
MLDRRLTNWLLLMAAAFLFSTGGAAIKAMSLTPWQIASFRSGIAALALAVFVPDGRRHWRWLLVPVAAAYAVTLISFTLATRMTTSANAIFLQSTAPLYLLLIGPLLLKEPLSRSDLLFLAAVAGGMILCFASAQPAVATAPDPRTGNLWGAASGLSWALTVSGLRWLGRRPGASNAATATVVMGNLLACLVTLPKALPVPHAGLLNLGVLFYLGVFQIGLAYLFVTRAIRHVPAFEATTVLLLEPALNPVWVWLVQGEQPAANSVAGGVLILSATLANAWWQSRRR